MVFVPKTIAENLSYTQKALKEQGINNALMESRWLFCWLLECSTQELVRRMQENMQQIQQERLEHCLKRRCNREPLAYITGQTEFYDIALSISRDVLIPRADTEALLNLCFELYPPTFETKPTLVDLGTGSGCLISVLAGYYSQGSYIATDISEKALQCARKNFKSQYPDKECLFLQGNYLSVLSEQSVDIVVSNPPYIATRDIERLSPEIVLYEPKLALDGGNDGLEAYRNIFSQISQVLKPKGLLILEIGHTQEESVKILANELCNGKLLYKAQKKDLAGVTRAIAWQKSS